MFDPIRIVFRYREHLRFYTCPLLFGSYQGFAHTVGLDTSFFPFSLSCSLSVPLRLYRLSLSDLSSRTVLFLSSTLTLSRCVKVHSCSSEVIPQSPGFFEIYERSISGCDSCLTTLLGLTGLVSVISLFFLSQFYFHLLHLLQSFNILQR